MSFFSVEDLDDCWWLSDLLDIVDLRCFGPSAKALRYGRRYSTREHQARACRHRRSVGQARAQ